MGLFDRSKSDSAINEVSDIKQGIKGVEAGIGQHDMNGSEQSSLSSQMNQGIEQEEYVNPFANPTSQVQENSLNLQNSSAPSSQDLNSQNPNSSIPTHTTPQHIEVSNTQMQQEVQPQIINTKDVQALINETVEKIIEEKWTSLTENVQKVVDWKSKVEEQITLVKEDVVSMQESFSTLEKRLISKINNYDKSILDVGSEIKAMDKVFQKITPTLVNNVTELGRVVKDLKGVSLDSSQHTQED